MSADRLIFFTKVVDQRQKKANLLDIRIICRVIKLCFIFLLPPLSGSSQVLGHTVVSLFETSQVNELENVLFKSWAKCPYELRG